jgi:hypothetical protein
MPLRRARHWPVLASNSPGSGRPRPAPPGVPPLPGPQPQWRSATRTSRRGPLALRLSVMAPPPRAGPGQGFAACAHERRFCVSRAFCPCACDVALFTTTLCPHHAALTLSGTPAFSISDEAVCLDWCRVIPCARRPYPPRAARGGGTERGARACSCRISSSAAGSDPGPRAAPRSRLPRGLCPAPGLQSGRRTGMPRRSA